MPLDIVRDDSRRRFVVTGSGDFDSREVIVFFERMREEGTWAYGVLYDMRFVTNVPAVSALREVAEVAAQSPPGLGARGPLAIVVADQEAYTQACSYAALSRGRAIEIFRDKPDAEKWLSSFGSGRD
jgi:hypothetical protein